MTSWTRDELDAIGAADVIDIAARRPDGTLRPYTTIWVVRVGDELYVRSYRGRDGAWYQAVQRRPVGRIRAGGTERDASFERVTDIDEGAVDAAYRAKYGRYGGPYVEPMVASAARATTLRINAA
jgi:hypothetical protein